METEKEAYGDPALNLGRWLGEAWWGCCRIPAKKQRGKGAKRLPNPRCLLKMNMWAAEKPGTAGVGSSGQLCLVNPANYDAQKTKKFRSQIGRIENMRLKTHLSEICIA